jgi:hypothetical protein
MQVAQRTMYAKPTQTNTPMTTTRSDAVTEMPATRMVNATMLHRNTAPS